MRLFDRLLSVPAVELEIELRGLAEVPWSDFLLNPRRLRGSDFLMRWSQGVWSEHRIVEAVNATGEFLAIQYGPSSTAPEDTREMELYFERLEAAGLGGLKRPDLLIFDAASKPEVDKILKDIGGEKELPFFREADLKPLLSAAILAIECENSLWKCQKMPSYGKKLRPMKRLAGRPGLPKSAVLPTIIIKEEDRPGIRQWQENALIPLHIWHAFYDRAYGISLDKAETLIKEGLIEPKTQHYQAPGGANTTKQTYGIYYQYAYKVAIATTEPQAVADSLEDKNGHILPYVRFKGGTMELAGEALSVLQEASRTRKMGD